MFRGMDGLVEDILQKSVEDSIAKARHNQAMGLTETGEDIMTGQTATYGQIIDYKAKELNMNHYETINRLQLEKHKLTEACVFALGYLLAMESKTAPVVVTIAKALRATDCKSDYLSDLLDPINEPLSGAQ